MITLANTSSAAACRTEGRALIEAPFSPQRLNEIHQLALQIAAGDLERFNTSSTPIGHQHLFWRAQLLVDGKVTKVPGAAQFVEYFRDGALGRIFQAAFGVDELTGLQVNVMKVDDFVSEHEHSSMSSGGFVMVSKQSAEGGRHFLQQVFSPFACLDVCECPIALDQIFLLRADVLHRVEKIGRTSNPENDLRVSIVGSVGGPLKPVRWAK